MRSVLEEPPALDQRFAHQLELEMFEIAQSAMDQTSGPACGSGREIVFFQQDDRQPAQRGISRDCRAIDSSANNGEVEAASIEIGRHHAFHIRIVRRIGWLR